MGLKGFVQAGYYSKIDTVMLDNNSDTVMFTLRTLDKKDGTDMLQPLRFVVNRLEEEQKYLSKHTSKLPDKPQYPAVCSNREKMVPMWDDNSSQDEKNEYENTRLNYHRDMAAYDKQIKDLAFKDSLEAKKYNVYEKYFSKVKIYNNSNLLACAYEYVKSLDSFTGVNDEK